MLTIGQRDRSHASGPLPTVTISYQTGELISPKALPNVTELYRGIDLALPRPRELFTDPASADGNRYYIGV